MSIELNTDNREYITWKHEQLYFGLLGGLKTEGLERMRVTLKVEYKQQAVRHNLDLYNTDSLDKLVRRYATSMIFTQLSVRISGQLSKTEIFCFRLN